MHRMRGEGWKGIVAGAALALMAAPAMAQKTELLVYTALETDQIKAYETAFKAANPNIDVNNLRPGDILRIPQPRSQPPSNPQFIVPPGAR